MRILFLCLFSSFVCISQHNMDTIYGNPKKVHDKVIILDKNLKKKLKQTSRSSRIVNLKIFRKRSLVGFLENNKITYVNLKRKYTRNRLLINQSYSGINNDDKLIFKYEYDNKNRLIEENEIYDKTDFIKTRNFYNTKDSIIATTSFYSILPNDLIFTYCYRNSENRMTHYKRVYNDGASIFFYNLNKNNKIVQRHRIDFTNRDEYQKLKNSIYLKNNELLLIEEKDYDDNGNLISEKKYNEKNKLIYKRLSKFDSFNNLIHVESSSNPKDLNSYTYIKLVYNKNNNKIERSELFENKYDLESTKFYYKNNFLVRTVTIIGNHIFTTKYDYKFDKHKNWTEILKSVNGEIKYKWKRKISYYN